MIDSTKRMVRLMPNAVIEFPIIISFFLARKVQKKTIEKQEKTLNVKALSRKLFL